jgi:hypothetical protein
MENLSRLPEIIESKKKQSEDQFWDTVAKNVKFKATIEEDNSIDTAENVQIISRPSDIKINFGK